LQERQVAIELLAVAAKNLMSKLEQNENRSLEEAISH
jgi:hypothetical protein